jgi:hypothetical protein
LQNKYAGDVGDFGKLGLLRQISDFGLSIGVNWYLMPDDGNNDGKHIAYLHAPRFLGCDDELHQSLHDIVQNQKRCVRSIEAAALLPGALYYNQPLKEASARTAWHQNALHT